MKAFYATGTVLYQFRLSNSGIRTPACFRAGFEEPLLPYRTSPYQLPATQQVRYGTVWRVLAGLLGRLLGTRLGRSLSGLLYCTRGLTWPLPVVPPGTSAVDCTRTVL